MNNLDSNKEKDIVDDGSSQQMDNESLKSLISAFTEAARKKLEYDVAYYSIKRREGNIFTLSYYRKKLYKAILTLREYNNTNEKK